MGCVKDLSALGHKAYYSYYLPFMRSPAPKVIVALIGVVLWVVGMWVDYIIVKEIVYVVAYAGPLTAKRGIDIMGIYVTDIPDILVNTWVHTLIERTCSARCRSDYECFECCIQGAVSYKVNGLKMHSFVCIDNSTIEWEYLGLADWMKLQGFKPTDLVRPVVN